MSNPIKNIFGKKPGEKLSGRDRFYLGTSQRENAAATQTSKFEDTRARDAEARFLTDRNKIIFNEIRSLPVPNWSGAEDVLEDKFNTIKETAREQKHLAQVKLLGPQSPEDWDIKLRERGLGQPIESVAPHLKI